MEMITIRYEKREGLLNAAITTLVDTLGLCVSYDSNERTRIEILYGNVLSNADFSIVIPKAVPEKESRPPYDRSYKQEGNTIRFVSDIFNIYSEMLCGNLEKTIKNLEFDDRKELVRSPFVDLIGMALFDAVCDACSTLKVPLIQKSYWPDGKQFAVCLTHDVDEVRKTYQWITYPLRCIKDRSAKRLYLQGVSFVHKLAGSEPYWTFDRLLELERSHNVTSTFFFLQETGKVNCRDISTWRHAGRRYRFRDKKISSLIQKMNAGGWEVGLHGSFYSYRDFGILHREKDDLESVSGNPIWGTRQHNLNLEIPGTWLIQEKAGLIYDTTLGFNDCLGFRFGTSFPFRFYLHEEDHELKILEIPLVVEDTAYFRQEHPWEQFCKIVDSVKGVHGILTLLWHHSVFNESEFPGWGEAYRAMCEYCREKNAWITNGREIALWWLNREKITCRGDSDGRTTRITFKTGSAHGYFNIYLPGGITIKESSGIKNIFSAGNMFTVRVDPGEHHLCTELGEE